VVTRQQMPWAHSIRSFKVWSSYEKQTYNRFAVFLLANIDATHCLRRIHSKRAEILAYPGFPAKQCVFSDKLPARRMSYICAGGTKLCFIAGHIGPGPFRRFKNHHQIPVCPLFSQWTNSFQSAPVATCKLSHCTELNLFWVFR
jgi:hypothetical protein